jgi:hypothetical protein
VGCLDVRGDDDVRITGSATAEPERATSSRVTSRPRSLNSAVATSRIRCRLSSASRPLRRLPGPLPPALPQPRTRRHDHDGQLHHHITTLVTAAVHVLDVDSKLGRRRTRQPLLRHCARHPAVANPANKVLAVDRGGGVRPATARTPLMSASRDSTVRQQGSNVRQRHLADGPAVLRDRPSGSVRSQRCSRFGQPHGWFRRR